jgi:hypothetical protein
VEGEDVRVTQPGHQLDLTQESIGTDAGRELRMQDLDRDLASVLQVLGQQHHGHAAAADLRLDGVTAGKC